MAFENAAKVGLITKAGIESDLAETLLADGNRFGRVRYLEASLVIAD